MYEDEVIEEVHRVKDAIAEKYNYDLRAYARYLQERQKQHGHNTVNLPAKRVEAKISNT
jgi:hypothetical protein